MDTKIYETRDYIDEDIIKIYPYGSIVYGCNTRNSDYDYIVVVKSNKDLYYSVQKPNADYHVYSKSMFIKKIKEHYISALECIFQDPDNDPFIKYFKLNNDTLRRSISGTSSNSFSKAHKKIDKENEIYIGKKSLFHSLRILDFGTQIAEKGCIYNYGSCNHLHKEIINNESNIWQAYKIVYKKMFKEYKNKFKKVCPLDSELNE